MAFLGDGEKRDGEEEKGEERKRKKKKRKGKDEGENLVFLLLTNIPNLFHPMFLLCSLALFILKYPSPNCLTGV